MDLLLEDFKKVSKRIVIVEYVRDREVAEGSFVHRVNNYLKDTDFTIDDKEFSEQEFMKVMALHGYRVKVCKGNYRVGLYERN